jgi:hypothetical protein
MEPSTGWLARAPFELVEVHLAANQSLRILYETQRINEVMDDRRERPRRERQEYLRRWAKRYAEKLVLMRDTVKKGRECLRQVWADFAVVAGEVTDCGGFVHSVSYHHLAIEMGLGMTIGLLNEASYFQPGELVFAEPEDIPDIQLDDASRIPLDNDDYVETLFPGFWTFTVEEMARYIVPAAREDPRYIEFVWNRREGLRTAGR